MAEAAASSSSSGSSAPRRLHGAGVVRDALPYGGLAASPPPPPPLQQLLPPPVAQQAQGAGGGGGGGGKISPAVLFIIVILAVVFFISGLLHLLVRVLMKKQHRRGGGRGGPASSAAARGDAGGADAALQRQLQQLFHLHDSGLDQAFIDALPVFAYREIVVGGGGGGKEPFDCAVCLCEFDAEDRLRLLPLCGHAFHLNCIDTWLLSNSTCPLCRGVLFGPGLMGDDNPMFDFEERLEEGRLSEDCDDGFGLPGQKASGLAQTPAAEKRVFPVRLGKFKNVGTQGAVQGGNANANANPSVLSRDQGESSSSSLDGRRCFSMGTYQYVLGTSELRVALQPGQVRNGAGGAMRGRPAGLSSINADIMEGKRICARNKGESFSVSKIWQWSNLKGKLPAGSDECSDARSLPWMKRGGAADTSNI
ncbi:hypothetical protein GQ55_4G280200 [Panicum hallii var. hallii]|uniref:RING-type E3 ubiquitin transferase n=1 Tax=Panicum hallii var. hallii TaxID=1504633 RepID=A0A2T7E0X6_9POAL|nr:hypothetical protein GQ55_4G280200 [Panicum hallii var. hallii]